MKSKFKTEQENFWAGEFGDDYIKRNDDKKILAGNINLFSSILKNTSPINSIVEYGPNIGLNLMSLKTLFPEVKISAVEINEKAVNQLKKNRDIDEVHHASLLNFKTRKKWDLTLVKGVLIHVNPDELPQAYEL
ncbi:MAG TPA: pseudaminic acid biosynthesis-associated methylase, partial [Candidatus Wallbacteria bacterium]|nr:pseudaminic acid biosynthesis-associated methylase [Candidatus Wallbacteria bacterium]